MLTLTHRTPPQASTPWLAVPADLPDIFAHLLGADCELAQRQVVPAMDITQTEDAFTLVMELPGLKASDVNISIEDNVLTVSGEKARPQATDASAVHAERRFGSFTRRAALPVGVEADKVQAQFQDGLLTVTLPKVQVAKPRRIEVKSV